MAKLYLGTREVTPAIYTGSATTTLSVTPTTSAQNFTPTSPYSGYSSVSVSAVTSSIDANITAGNIKKDVTILGVTGTYEGGGGVGTGIGTAIMFYTEEDPDNYDSMVIEVSINGGTPISIDFKSNCSQNLGLGIWFLNYIISNQNLDPEDGAIAGDIQVTWIVDNGDTPFENEFGFVDSVPVFANFGRVGAA